jgi:hypothetical protein
VLASNRNAQPSLPQVDAHPKPKEQGPVPTPKSWQSNRTLAGRTGKQAADTPRLLAPTGYRTSGDYTNFSPKAMKDEPEAIGRVEVVRMADEASLVSEEKREIRRWQRKQPKRLTDGRNSAT